jgi:hypothetical protein
MRGRREALGMVGTFLVMLGAGAILDGDLSWVGTLAMVVGVSCLVAGRR